MPAKTLLTSLVVLSALTFAAHAQAAPAPAGASVKVSMSDLNLHTQAGAAIGLRRIEAASNRVCGGAPDARRLDQQAVHRACMRETMERAVASLGSPLVTAQHTDQGRTITSVSSH
ncbi:MAG TPA: UrcA family protein [Phenylobacterium sp.]